MHYKIQPWAHQLRAIEAAEGKTHYALFFEQGCGKTSTVINMLRAVYDRRNGVVSTLVLCPSIVVENWRREFLSHSDIADDEVISLVGTGSQRLLALDKWLSSGSNLKKRVVITNYEAMYMKLYDALNEWSPEAIILDESHKIKELTAKRTKKVIALSKTASYKYILTGTPILNSPMDIYSQFLFLDGGETFGSNYYKFRSEYFVDHNAHRPRHCYFPDWRPREGSLEKINACIYTKAMRVLKSQCLDLPPFVRQTVEVEMTGEQLRVYKDMESDAVAYFKNDVISADLAITKALRLQQIVTGYVTNDEGQLQIFPDNQRIEALGELLESIGENQKVIVWAVFKQNYEDIRRLLGHRKISYTELTGETPPGDRQRNVDLFNRETGPRVLIANPASAGIGVNLVAASYAIYFSRGFSLENDLQSEARNYRGGSERHSKVTRIDIVTRGSMDLVVLEALKNKQDVSEAILYHMRKQ